jgi:rubrerythrin
MSLATLFPVERQTLGAKAEERCLNRVREILRRADPADAALRRLLQGVERQNRIQLESIREIGAEGEQEDVVVDLDAHFPSLRERLGEGPLNRDCALFFIERLKEEAWRFFERMALRAMDEDARAVYTHIALDDLGQVARLRAVIL